MRPGFPPLSNPSATRGGQLTLSNVINDASRALGLTGDGLSNDGTSGFWDAATNLCSNSGFKTNKTGVTDVSATSARIAAITDSFTRANGAIGNTDTGQSWIQAAAGGTNVLAVISGNALVAPDSGGANTTAYSRIDLGAGSVPVSLKAVISFDSNPTGGAVMLGCSPTQDVTAGSVHITFADTACYVAYWDTGAITTVATYTYASPCSRDGVTKYNIGWSQSGSKLVIDMPDGTQQTYTNANFAAQQGRYCTFEHYYPSGKCAPAFYRVAINEVAKFGTACLNVVTGNAAANEGIYETFTATAAAHAVSAWVRGCGGTVRMAVRDNAGANAQTGSAVTLSTTPQRISLITTALSAATWRIYVESDSQQAITFQVDGVQPELGAFMTPTILTDGGTASRSAARGQMPTQGIINPGKFGIAFRVRMGFPSTGPGVYSLFEVGTGGSNRLVGAFDFTADQWSLLRQVGGSFSFALSAAQTFAVGDYATVIFRGDGASIGTSVNGGAFVTSANTAIPTASTLFDLFSAPLSSYSVFNGNCLWVAPFANPPTNADAALIHAAFQNTKPTIRALDSVARGAHAMTVWDGRGNIFQRRIGA